jgi:type IV pilus biogenesis protein CpaD/CtpE
MDMKKYMVVAVAALSLAACSGAPEETVPDEPTDAVTETAPVVEAEATPTPEEVAAAETAKGAAGPTAAN